jgi:DNA-binding NtrC family response regulator
MSDRSVLVVDDEKNIRLTLRETLRGLELDVDTAVNGEEALTMASQQAYDLALLDLKMPGMDGLEALRHLRDLCPGLAVVILTAHGTVETAVEAMKLGAVDFLQKPFAPQEIRDVVSRVLQRKEKQKTKPQDYRFFIRSAREHLRDRLLDVALEQIRTAISLDPGKPEAFNLMGAACELRQDVEGARKYYRTAYWLDPSYEPSRLNIERQDIGAADPSAIHLGQD